MAIYQVLNHYLYLLILEHLGIIIIGFIKQTFTKFKQLLKVVVF